MVVTFTCHKTQNLYNQLVEALDEAKKIHSIYEEEINRHDPDWSLYYTGHAFGRIPNLLKVIPPRQFQLFIEIIPLYYRHASLTWSEQAAWYVLNENIGEYCPI